MLVFLVLALSELAKVSGDDTGCNVTHDGVGPGQCVQYGCCLDAGHFNDSQLCDGVGEVCCYRRDICNPSSARREHRALWVASVTNIDWPQTSNQSYTESWYQLKEVFALAAEMKMNAVYLQVRPMGDALYNSAIEPWSGWLTGAQGVPPSPLWDPLQEAVTWGSQYVTEVHAWLNPYRANTENTTTNLSPQSWCIKFSQYCYPYHTYMWMDPGVREVQDHLYNVIMDIATRYDVDGIHFDDYFYPYPHPDGSPFPDDATYNAYLASGGQMSRDDWRRNNIDQMLERIYAGLRSLPTRPYMKFTVSPFGLYRAGHPEGMPPPIEGFDPYSEIYADAKKWLNNGWLDRMQPQLYWKVNATNQPYEPLLEWWVSQNTHNRHVDAGLYFSRIDPSVGDWAVEEIQQEVAISRQYTTNGSYGNVLFSYRTLRDNVKNVQNVLKIDPYSDWVQRPEMTWIRPADAPPVPAPVNLRFANGVLYWDADTSGVVHFWGVYQSNFQQITMQGVIQKWASSWYGATSGTWLVRGFDRSYKEGPIASIVVM